MRLDDEVDFPIALAPVIELEIGREGGVREVGADRRLLVGAGGIDVEAFLSSPVSRWLQ